MKTADEWKQFLSAMPAQDLPEYNQCIQKLIAELAEQYARWDQEVEAEVEAATSQ
jgi:hypothetical protein